PRRHCTRSLKVSSRRLATLTTGINVCRPTSRVLHATPHTKLHQSRQVPRLTLQLARLFLHGLAVDACQLAVYHLDASCFLQLDRCATTRTLCNARPEDIGTRGALLYAHVW